MRNVYKKLSLGFCQKSKTNYEQAQAEFQLTLNLKNILKDFLSNREFKKNHDRNCFLEPIFGIYHF